jgi:hypothetical protein
MYLNRIYKLQEKTYRIVYEGIDYIWYIELENKNAWPELMSLTDVEEYLDNKELDFIPEVYQTPPLSNELLIPKRDEAYQSILPLISDTPAIFDKSKRNALIKQAVSTGNHPRIYYIRYLRKFYQQGMTANSLLANYCNSGGRGKVRRKSAKKVGKKRDSSDGVGVVVDEKICKLFDLAITGYYFTNFHATLQSTYIKFVNIYRSNYPQASYTEIPTEDQFKYYYYKNHSKKEVLQTTTPNKIYDNDIKALLSTSANLNIGPGGRYEIDATIVDIYLVSEHDPELIVGRPTLYLVKDVFSRMVVGFYLGFENASWVTATLAMINAFCDKVDFCKSYGIDIAPEHWPSVGIPTGMMADKGELLGHQADTLVDSLNIALSNSRSYLGSDKGGVERGFNTIQTSFKPYAKGIVEPVNGKKRLGHRYELDAELNLTQFTKMVIHIILNHNNGRAVKGYDFSPDMPFDSKSVPLQLWNWGIKNRTGKLMYKDEKFVRLNLLPQEKGTLSDKGIKFKGLFYTCIEAIKAGWLERTGETGRPESVIISFDPRIVDEVYIRFEGDLENYWVCKLSDRSRRYRSLSFPEASILKSLENKAYNQSKQKYVFDAAELQEQLEEITNGARAKKPKYSTKTKSSRLRGIKENKQNEKKLERTKTIKPLTNSVIADANKAEVVDIKTGHKKKKFKLPSIEELLGDDE